MYKKNLAASEYLPAFDTYCEQVWSALGLEIVSTDKSVLSFTEILDLRQKAMITAYKKYGPVYYNYLQAQLMQPLQNSWIRMGEYQDTRNVKYLVDVLNFIMLAYWHMTDKVETIPTDEELLYVQATIIQLNERYTELPDRFLSYLETYSDTDDGTGALCYLAALMYLVYMEILSPTIDGAYYDGKSDGRVCALAGIYINQYV